MQRQPENLEMSLREHLLAAQQSATQAGMQTSPPYHHHDHMHHHPGAGGPHGHNIDPAIGGNPYAMSPETGDEDMHDKRNGKRELSKTKRAAQNRAAQRAFRQRKESYIKNLEDEVRAFKQKEDTWTRIQQENYQLRDYIINLQSRLLESQGDYPLPPPTINLPHPRDPPDERRQQQQQLPQQQQPVPTAPMGSGGAIMGPNAVNQLQAAAAQAGELEGKADAAGFAATVRANVEAMGAPTTAGNTISAPALSAPALSAPALSAPALSAPAHHGLPYDHIYIHNSNTCYDEQHPIPALEPAEATTAARELLGSGGELVDYESSPDRILREFRAFAQEGCEAARRRGLARAALRVQLQTLRGKEG